MGLIIWEDYVLFNFLVIWLLLLLLLGFSFSALYLAATCFVTVGWAFLSVVTSCHFMHYWCLAFDIYAVSKKCVATSWSYGFYIVYDYMYQRFNIFCFAIFGY